MLFTGSVLVRGEMVWIIADEFDLLGDATNEVFSLRTVGDRQLQFDVGFVYFYTLSFINKSTGVAERLIR